MDDLLQNLIFVLVALGAWALKAVLERKEAAGRRAPRSRPGDGTAHPAPKRMDTGERDVVYGRSPVPPSMAPRPQRKGTPAITSDLPEAVTSTLQGLGSGAASADVTSFETRRIEATAHHTAAELEVAGAMARSGNARGLRRVAVLRRLGASDPSARRRILRAGVLWSEVLGSPRAVMGPHRSPVARRLARS